MGEFEFAVADPAVRDPQVCAVWPQCRIATPVPAVHREADPDRALPVIGGEVDVHRPI